MKPNSESRTLGRGAPTAVTGEEWGVKRRFEFLLSFASLKDKAVLDLGCGFGAYSQFAVASKASLVVGIDMNRKYLLSARAAERVQSSGDTLPFNGSCFDVVVMIEVLDHPS